MDLNTKNLFASRLNNPSAVNESDYANLKQRLLQVKQKFQDGIANQPFAQLPMSVDQVKIAVAKAQQLAAGFKQIVVVGIGGSDLGARAVHQALNGHYYNEMNMSGDGKKIYFAGDTTDPAIISDLLQVLDLRQTLFIVVSKSGNTIEQASNFVLFRERVKGLVGEEEHKKHFVFVTSTSSGTLSEIANSQGYEMIEHPEVGGRFSVLSAVGMVPVSLVGVNYENVIAGAREMATEINRDANEIDLALEYVAFQYLYMQKGRNIAVMMPYLYNLRDFSKWYKQLWAESIGKEVDLAGNKVNVGTTPVESLGPVDQHSQLQLFNEGPDDKVITFITAGESMADLELPGDYSGVEQFAYFAGKSFHEILNGEYETTRYSVTKYGKPNCTISIPKLDEFNLGKMLYFFEQVTVYMGLLLNIDPYNQPGVETSKNAMFGVLGKAGFEQEKAEFEKHRAE